MDCLLGGASEGCYSDLAALGCECVRVCVSDSSSTPPTPAAANQAGRAVRFAQGVSVDHRWIQGEVK